TIKKEDTIGTIVHQSFLFTRAHVAALRCLVPLHLRQCTAFDLITACFWCCRTKALQLEPEDEVRMMCAVNARSRLSANHSSLVGYYGNCFAFPAAVTSVGKLICGNPLGYAVELIKKAKGQVTEEYMHSLADLMVIKERHLDTTIRSCVVSDMIRAKYTNVNFGWGDAVYGGVVKGGAGPFPGATFIVSHKNAKEEEGLILLTYLPYEDMKRFAEELDKMFGNQNQPTTIGPSFVMSTL
ncbi:benzyl alcohol O-benzoyltransferase-like protein, partial [Trifolium pratense]